MKTKWKKLRYISDEDKKRILLFRFNGKQPIIFSGSVSKLFKKIAHIEVFKTLGSGISVITTSMLNVNVEETEYTYIPK